MAVVKRHGLIVAILIGNNRCVLLDGTLDVVGLPPEVNLSQRSCQAVKYDCGIRDLPCCLHLQTTVHWCIPACFRQGTRSARLWKIVAAYRKPRDEAVCRSIYVRPACHSLLTTARQGISITRAIPTYRACSHIRTIKCSICQTQKWVIDRPLDPTGQRVPAKGQHTDLPCFP